MSLLSHHGTKDILTQSCRTFVLNMCQFEMNSQDASVQTVIAGIETPFLAEMDKVNLEACLASHA